MNLVSLARQGVLVRGFLGVLDDDEENQFSKRKCSARIDSKGNFVLNFPSEKEYEAFVRSRNPHYVFTRPDMSFLSQASKVIQHLVRNISHCNILISIDQKVSSLITLSLDGLVSVADCIRDDEIVLSGGDSLSIHKQAQPSCVPKLLQSLHNTLLKNQMLSEKCSALTLKCQEIQEALMKCIEEYEGQILRNEIQMHSFSEAFSKQTSNSAQNLITFHGTLAQSSQDSLEHAELVNSQLIDQTASMQSSLSIYQNELNQLTHSREQVQTLLDEKNVLQQRLEELEQFLESSGGNALCELERQLAQAKLLLAQAEAEKDLLEMQLEELR